MPQFTPLNRSPYFDNFDEDSIYHRILFTPGRALQARELTQIQSILQSQIEKFGSYFLTQGQQIVPGELNLTSNLNYVKISFVSDLTFIDTNEDEISIVYDVKRLKNKQVRGQNSGIVATIVDVKEATPETSLTLFVNYQTGGFSRTEEQFRQGENLVVVGEEATTPEFTVATNNNGLPTSISVNGEVVSNAPLGFAFAASVEDGIYYINGFFVNNKQQIIIVDSYYNKPNAKIGFLVEESLITENEDKTLYDNSRGSTNYRAPGAHRLAINLQLISYDDDTQVPNNFVEIASIKNGQLESQIVENNVDIVQNESENYVLSPFLANINEQNLEISQGTAIIGNTYVKNEKTIKIPLEKSTETFVSNNKTINVGNLPSFSITDVVGSSPLNGENSELTPYPNILLNSLQNYKNSSNSSVRTVLVEIKDRDLPEPNGSLWIRLSNNEAIEPIKLDVISYTKINDNIIEFTLEGNSNIVENFLINYNTLDESYERYLYSSRDLANDINSVDNHYGKIVYYSNAIHPIIGRVKPLDTQLVEIDNTFNPDTDITIPSTSIFKFSYFDPQYYTKIVLRSKIKNESDAFNTEVGSYIFDIDNEAYGSIERIIGNKILIVKTLYGKFESGRAIKDINNKVEFIAQNSTISHLIVGNKLPVINLSLYIDGVKIDRNKFSIIENLNIIHGIELKDYYVQYNHIPTITVKDGNDIEIDLDVTAFLHTNTVIEYAQSDVKSIYGEYGNTNNVFSANLILNEKKILNSFSKISPYRLFSLNGIQSNIRENSFVEYSTIDGIRKVSKIQSSSQTEIVVNEQIINDVQNSDFYIITSKNEQNLNTLVFPTGSRRTSQIYNSTFDASITYYYKKDFITTATLGGDQITFESKIPFGTQKFAPYNKDNYLLTVLKTNETSTLLVGDIIYIDPKTLIVTDNTVSVKINSSFFGVDSDSPSTTLPILKLTATVINTDAKPKTKTLVKNKRITISNFGDPIILLRGKNYDSNSNDILSYSDILKVNYIYQGNSTRPPQINRDGTLNTSTGQDITHKYIIDNGQRDTFYDVGRLILKSNESPASGQVVIGFDYFEHSNELFFTVDSYVHDSGLTEEEIPIFNSNVYGNISLSNIIDFRPKVDYNASTPGFGTATLLNSTSFNGDGASLTSLPVSTNSSVPYTIEFDEKQYLDRIDGIFLTKDNEFIYKKGNSSLNPSRPNSIQDSIILYYLYVPAFTKSYKDIKIIQPNNVRYNISDIASLEKRIERLEYYTSQSVLEQQAQQMQIKDEFGFERYKTGFIVDNFEDHKFGNISSSYYSCSIDPQESTLKPEVYETSVDLREYDKVDKQYVTNNNIACLPYVSRRYISSLFSSSEVNPNPFVTRAFDGDGILNPNIDTWYDEVEPPLIQNDNTNLYSVVKTKETGLSSVHNSYQINWLGVIPPLSSNTILPLNTSFDDLLKNEDFANVSSSSNISPQNNVLGKGISTKSINGRLINNSIQFYGRKKLIKFKIRMLKPNTEHFVFLDGQNIRRWINPDSIYTGIPGNSLSFFNNRIFSDENGNISGIMVFPNGHPPKDREKWNGELSSLNFSTNEPKELFLAGDKNIIFTSNQNNEIFPVSSATLKYYITGILETNTSSVSSASIIESKKLQSTVIVNGQEKITPNPLTQIFNVQNSPGGICLTGLDLFIKNKGRTLPIKVFLAPVKNNLPTDEIIPGSVSIKNPNTKIRVKSGGRNTILIGETILGATTNANGILLTVIDRNNRIISPNIRNEVVLENGQSYTLIIDSLISVDYIQNEELIIQSVVNYNSSTNRNNMVIIDFDRGNLSEVKLIQSGENYETAIAAVEPPATSAGVRALVSLQLHDGRIYNTSIIEPGAGYRAAPAIDIRGTGSNFGGAEVESKITITSPAVEMGIISNPETEPSTYFEFQYPVYLQNNRSYALIIQTDSNEYILASSKIKERDRFNSRIINDNKNLGSLYKSQNIHNWKEETNENLKVIFYNAEFDTSADGELILINSPLDLQPLQINPFETNAEATINSNSDLFKGNNKIVKVHHKNHGFEDSGLSYVFYKNANATSGITTNTLNQSFFNIDNVGVDSYTISVLEDASSTDFGGGHEVYASSNKKYETLYPQMNVLEIDNTNIDVHVKTTNIIPIDNTVILRNYTSYSESNYEQTFMNEVHYFDNQKIIASPINQTFNNKEASLYYRLKLSSSNKNISPMIDVSNCSVKLQTNRIQFSTGDERRYGVRPQRLVFYPVYKIALSQPIDLGSPIEGFSTKAQGRIVSFDTNNPNVVYVRLSSTNNFEIGEFVNVNSNEEPTIVVNSIPEKEFIDVQPATTLTARNESDLDIVYDGKITGNVIYNEREHDTLLINQFNKESSAVRLSDVAAQERDVFRVNDIITYNGQLSNQREFWKIREVIFEKGLDYVPMESFNNNDVMSYITKEINLKESSNNIDVRLTANLHDNSEIVVFYKTKFEYSQDDFDTIKWVMLEDNNILKSNQINSSNFNESQNDYQELSYFNHDINAFTSFAIKIILRSKDPTKIPKVQDVRVVCSI